MTTEPTTTTLDRARPERRAPLARRRVAVAVTSAVLLLGACSGGGSSDGDGATSDGGSGASEGSGSSSSDGPSGDVPIAPFNNPDVDDPEALGTRRLAPEPGQWFAFEHGYSARIESVRAAEAGEVETEAMSGGASIINVQVHYDGDEASSDRVWFQLDTTMDDEAFCADQGAGYGPITMEKGETVDIPFCLHLEDRGNGITLFSYPDNRQSWGAWYAVVGPEGVIEPDAPPATDEGPGF